MSVCPNPPRATAAPGFAQLVRPSEKVQDKADDSLEDVWESTKIEVQCQEKKQKENWLKHMSSFTEEPGDECTPAGGGHIGHYGKFTFGEDDESSGNVCSVGESSDEEEVELAKKRKREEENSSDDSSDIEIISRPKKRKIEAEKSTEEVLLPELDLSEEESESKNVKKTEDEKEATSEANKMHTKATASPQASQGSDSLWLEDEDGEEKEWDIPEEFRVKPAEMYENLVELSDNELEHCIGKKDVTKSERREEEKLVIRLRWKKGRRYMEKKIMVTSGTKFKQIKHLVFENFGVKLKMMFDGEVIEDSDTAESLGLEITLDGDSADLIDCVLI